MIFELFATRPPPPPPPRCCCSQTSTGRNFFCKPTAPLVCLLVLLLCTFSFHDGPGRDVLYARFVRHEEAR